MGDTEAVEACIRFVDDDDDAQNFIHFDIYREKVSRYRVYRDTGFAIAVIKLKLSINDQLTSAKSDDRKSTRQLKLS